MSTVIQGIIRLVTPLHHASENTKTDDGKGNVTRTAVQTIYPKSGRTEVPYFKATSLRGGLRRDAARIVLGHLTTDKKIQRGLFTGMMTGSENAAPDSASLTVEEALRARKNVFMGLFGGGARMLPSRYYPQDMLPVIPSTIDIGMVPSKYAEGEDNIMVKANGRDLINTYSAFSVDDVVRVMNIDDIENFIENSVEAIAEHQASVAANKDERKSAKTSKDTAAPKKIDKSNILNFEAIAAGVPLYFRLSLKEGVTDAQIGLMLKALTKMINDQDFGGWIRAGFGRVSADLTINVEDEVVPVFMNGDDKYLLNPSLEDRFGAALQIDLHKLTVPEMQAFYSNRGE